MNKDLKITIVQANLVWEDTDTNLSAFSQKFKSIKPSSTDLIVLPEMFNTGFTMNAKAVAEPMNGRTMEWMAQTAAQKKCVITGSFIIKENKKFYNRLIWMRPDGTFEIYDKRHLFSMAKEDKNFTSGNKRQIVELKGWRICPLICYDLRFPVWSRNAPQTLKGALNSGYDCLIYVANWPEKRSYAWRQLLIARAIENQAYVIGINRIGNDGNGYDYKGESVVLNTKGEPLNKPKSNVESIETLTLSYKELESFRKEFPVGLDADKFIIM
jgi:predicted amidohydrolase